MKVKISQSLIKDLEKYMDGQKCGHIIYNKYTKSIFEPPSEWMEEGIYFEYLATGALPKSGEIPQPRLLKTEKREWELSELQDYLILGVFPGKIRTEPLGVDVDADRSRNIEDVFRDHKEAVFVASMTAEYRRAYEQARIFKRFCKDMGIEILGTQKTTEKNGLVGTLDIHANWKGRGEVTIDLKYSGLINDLWNEIGWGDMYGKNDREKQYRNHSIQSKQYTYLFDRPFFFWVFSSVNIGENILIEMVHDQNDLDEHLEFAKESAKRWNILVAHEKSGFSALPEYNACQKCVLYDSCQFRAELPIPKPVKRN